MENEYNVNFSVLIIAMRSLLKKKKTHNNKTPANITVFLLPYFNLWIAFHFEILIQCLVESIQMHC